MDFVEVCCGVFVSVTADSAFHELSSNDKQAKGVLPQGATAMSAEGASCGMTASSMSGLRPGYRIEPLNRLAFPKGKIPKCEISGQAASVACITPHITLYYATEEQAEQAWHGKNAKISVYCMTIRRIYWLA